MKLALSQILGRPVIFNGMVVGYAFIQALHKLAADPAQPVKARYALARTIQDCELFAKAFDQTRTEVFKRHAVTRQEFLQRREHALKQELAICVADKPKTARLQESLSRISTELQAFTDETPNPLVPANEQAAAKINAELEAALADEVEVFLDNKITLSEDSKLTGGEMATLMAIIAIQ